MRAMVIITVYDTIMKFMHIKPEFVLYLMKYFST